MPPFSSALSLLVLASQVVTEIFHKNPAIGDIKLKEVLGHTPRQSLAQKLDISESGTAIMSVTLRKRKRAQAKDSPYIGTARQGVLGDLLCLNAKKVVKDGECKGVARSNRKLTRHRKRRAERSKDKDQLEETLATVNVNAE
eukprot:1154183-Pelagomonas_calceolata.AAC.4